MYHCSYKVLIFFFILKKSVNIYKSHGKHVEETAPYLLNIMRFLDIHLGVSFKEMIGDFIKDESGTWWLINVKGFLI